MGEIIISVLLLFIGLVVLIVYSDIFVEASTSLALKLKVPKMLIALTIAAFGTCAPELAISFNSMASGNIEMTFANVIGSLIVNILLIVGVAAIVNPINVKERTVKKELPILLFVTIAFFILINDNILNSAKVNSLGRADALILLGWFAFFIYYIISLVRKNSNEEVGKPKYSKKKSIILIIVSLVAIVLSSDVVVDAASVIATGLGISEKIIAMTVVVIGTSLPELTLTVESAKKGEFDMAVGNIIGTNIFNICIVLGLPILIYGKAELAAFSLIDMIIVLIAALMFFVFGRSNRKLSRREGIMMVLVFVVYYTYILFFQ